MPILYIGQKKIKSKWAYAYLINIHLLESTANRWLSVTTKNWVLKSYKKKLGGQKRRSPDLKICLALIALGGIHS